MTNNFAKATVFSATISHEIASKRNYPLKLHEMRRRQKAKIEELRNVLAASGLGKLDAQAKALGLPRSTTWHLLRGNHKGSGLSAPVIKRILAAPRLPAPVRAKVLEYVAEKAGGLYGASHLRLNRFISQLPFSALEAAGVRTVGTPRTRLSFGRQQSANRIDPGRKTKADCSLS
jgi:hypothetical protein